MSMRRRQRNQFFIRSNWLAAGQVRRVLSRRQTIFCDDVGGVRLYIFYIHLYSPYTGRKKTQYHTINLTNKQLTWHNSGNSFENIYTSQYHHQLLTIRHIYLNYIFFQNNELAKTTKGHSRPRKFQHWLSIVFAYSQFTINLTGNLRYHQNQLYVM